MSPVQPVAECRDLTHIYRDDDSDATVIALQGVDLAVQPGEAIAVTGPSGAGKSTLLTMMAGLSRPTSGHVWVGGQDLSAMSERALLRLRARDVGIVMQTPGRNVLAYATALQNVVFAHRRSRTSRHQRTAEATRLLDSVGLGEHRHRPARLLSGGQQQRLAVAIALASRPSLLLVDEPTSQLPRDTGDAVVQLLLDTREQYDAALVVVTHDARVSAALDIVYDLVDGALHRRAPGLDGHRP